MDYLLLVLNAAAIAAAYIAYRKARKAERAFDRAATEKFYSDTAEKLAKHHAWLSGKDTSSVTKELQVIGGELRSVARELRRFDDDGMPQQVRQ